MSDGAIASITEQNPQADLAGLDVAPEAPAVERKRETVYRPTPIFGRATDGVPRITGYGKVDDYGGQMPVVSDRVIYWYALDSTHGNRMMAYAGTLLQPNPDGTWNLNFFRGGMVTHRPNVRYSDEPRPFCWSWPRPPRRKA